MSQLFKRMYRLRVHTVEMEGGAVGKQRFGIDVRYAVSKSTKKEPNKAQIEIFNLSADTRGELQKSHKEAATRREPLQVRLEAGYIDDMGVIFDGDLRVLTVKNEGPDWIVSINATEGGHAFRTAEIYRSFNAGTPVETVIRACAEAMGVGLGNLNDVIANMTIKGVGSSLAEGLTAFGFAELELDSLVRSTNYRYSIQRGVLQFQERGKAVNRQVLELSSDTGLVGSPEPVVDAMVLGKAGKAKPSKAGAVKFKALMLHQLYPGAQVRLNALNTKGDYHLTEVDFRGDTAGNEWNVECTARPING
jgi:hypothetical protein